MNTQTFTVTSEKDGYLFIMNLLDSTGRTVASLIADGGEKGKSYSLDINVGDNERDSPEIIVEFIQRFIEQTQEGGEEGFTIIIELKNHQDDKQYSEVAGILKEKNYIDSFRVQVIKSTAKKYLHLICETPY